MNPAHLPHPAAVQTKLGKHLGRKATAFFALLLLALTWATRSPSVPTVHFPALDSGEPARGGSRVASDTDRRAGGGILPPRRDGSELRIFVGVMTMAGRYELRHLHRLVNALQKPELPAGVRVDVRFVFCRLTSAEQRGMVSAEILRFDDLLILNCPHENMDNGKTYRFFSALARIFKDSYSTTGGTARGKQQEQLLPPYDYVMKADDDTYLRLPALAASLRPLPREDLYYGFQVDAGYFLKDDPAFMAGMGYALSWDLVEWVARWDPRRRTALGFEDRLVGKWLLLAGKGKNVYDTKPPGEYWGGGTFPIRPDKWFQYDIPRPPVKFLPNTVSVHRVKEYADWAKVLEHFNVTASVRPSRFYDIKLNFGRV